MADEPRNVAESLRVVAAIGREDRAAQVREIILRWRNDRIYNTAISAAGAEVVNLLNAAFDDLIERLTSGVK